jgi:CheY-like chemotaxis protein
MNNEVVFLLQIAILIVREHAYSYKSGDSRDKLLELIKQMNSKRAKNIIGGEDGMVVRLRGYLQDQLLSDKSVVSNYESIKLIVHGILDKEHITFYQVYVDEIGNIDKPEEELAASIESFRSHIFSYQNELELKQMVNKFYSTLSNINNANDREKAISELAIGINSLKSKSDSNQTLEDLHSIAFDDDRLDDKSQQKTFDIIQKNIEFKRSDKMVLKTGLQLVNGFLNGGLIRGLTYVIAGYANRYKSTMMLTMAVDIALYNEPKQFYEDKKPAIILFSVEDSIDDIYIKIYTYLYAIENKTPPDVRNTSIQDMKVYSFEKIQKRGFKLIIYRNKPANTTVSLIKDVIRKEEKNGYEIFAFFLDYLSEISSSDMEQSGMAGYTLLSMIKSLRNELLDKNIAFITAHQLKSTVMEVVEKGGVDSELYMLKQVANKGHYLSISHALDRMPDKMFYLHATKFMDGRQEYLTLHDGRDRQNIPDGSKTIFGFYPFEKGIPILPDIEDTIPNYLTKLSRTADSDDLDDELDI